MSFKKKVLRFSPALLSSLAYENMANGNKSIEEQRNGNLSNYYFFSKVLCLIQIEYNQWELFVFCNSLGSRKVLQNLK